jgi:putative ABC transport system permease protein
MLAPVTRHPSTIPVLFRLALRNLRGGLNGFRIFLACIALGVGAIVGVGSIALSLGDGLASQGRLILGGDLSISRVQRPAEPDELVWFRSLGSVTTTASLRAMALADTGQAGLVEIKAVDASYPTIGEVTLSPERPLLEVIAVKDGVIGAAADPALFARLGVAPGARIKIGDGVVELRSALEAEPDKLAGGVTFGPRLLMSQEGLAATRILQPGSLVRWTYRISLPPDANADANLDAIATDLPKRFPQAGFELRSRNNAAPQFTRNLERFTQFLTIVSLTALVVGGVGVANAVAAFVERRKTTLAILKSVGASGGNVFSIALIEVLIMGLAGTGIGLVIGAALPYLVATLAKSVLPVPLDPHVYPHELVLGTVYGLMAVLAFALWPLGRAHDVPVSALFRDEVAPSWQRPRKRYLALNALAVLGLAAAAILFAYDRTIAAAAVVATAGVFIILRLVAFGVAALARRLPAFHRAELRLAIANIHRPGALTPALVLSLGLGVTLLVTIALIDSNIRSQLARSLPERAPTFFFVDIGVDDLDRFSGFLHTVAPDGTMTQVPMMRGRITRLNTTEAGAVKAPDSIAWVLEGDRGITWSQALPEGSVLVEGQWWAPDYTGEPLVSFDFEIAKGLGLKVGDTVTVNVLGRDLTARIVNLRRVEWQSLGINFVMVFSPNSFAGAPFTSLATLTLGPQSDRNREGRILAESARQFPGITAVRVKDALEAIDSVVGKLVLAMRGASAVTLLASVLVLAGALGAGHRARVYDAVVLKTLGATRGRLLTAYLLEYGILGAITALFGLGAGTLAAWVVVARVMSLEFHFIAPSALVSAVGAVILTILLGLLGTWRILGQKPGPYLRSL